MKSSNREIGSRREREREREKTFSIKVWFPSDTLQQLVPNFLLVDILAQLLKVDAHSMELINCRISL